MRSPYLVLNPRDDDVFIDLVQQLVEEGIGTTDALQQALRERYRDAVVRERGLSHEPAVWYVYRDGHWVPSRGAGGGIDDARGA